MERTPSIFEHTYAPLGEKCIRFRHKSGLLVSIAPKEGAVQAAYLGVPAGNMHILSRKPDGSVYRFPNGSAHFLEHKLFENEDGEDSFDKFAVYGANANAFTTAAKTVYLFTCSEKESFLPCLRILLTGFLNPHFTDESIRKEREIITEEIQMYRDDPENELFYSMLRGLYGDHCISNQICGTPESIGKILPETLYDFYRQFYRPENAVLSLCGKMVPEEILPLLDELMPARNNASPSPADGLPAIPPIPGGIHEKRVSLSWDIPMPLFSIGLREDIPVVPRTQKIRRQALLLLLSQMLFDEFLPALYEDGDTPEEPQSDADIGEGYACLSFGGQAKDPEKIFSRFCLHLREKRENGFREEELRRAKKVLYASFLRMYDDHEAIAAEWLNFLLEGGDLFLLLDEILQEDPATLNAFARAFLKEENLVLSAAYPRAKS